MIFVLSKIVLGDWGFLSICIRRLASGLCGTYIGKWVIGGICTSIYYNRIDGAPTRSRYMSISACETDL